MTCGSCAKTTQNNSSKILHDHLIGQKIGIIGKYYQIDEIVPLRWPIRSGVLTSPSCSHISSCGGSMPPNKKPRRSPRSTATSSTTAEGSTVRPSVLPSFRSSFTFLPSLPLSFRPSVLPSWRRTTTTWLLSSNWKTRHTSCSCRQPQRESCARRKSKKATAARKLREARTPASIVRPFQKQMRREKQHRPVLPWRLRLQQRTAV